MSRKLLRHNDQALLECPLCQGPRMPVPSATEPWLVGLGWDGIPGSKTPCFATKNVWGCNLTRVPHLPAGLTLETSYREAQRLRMLPKLWPWSEGRLHGT